jgi:hypothetical protein
MANFNFTAKPYGLVADKNAMASSISAAAMLVSSMVNQKVMMEAAVAVMKKSNDVAMQQGEALVELMDSIPQTEGRLLDTYA